ncbi:MAG: RIP metalloprotease RseP [Deltaproteobacteria bacterium]|nr:RIP metalloprotease RseP [Deltaproteobacteria bacterium]
MLQYVLAFVILLGPLIFVHEFGHFLFAKLFNVRVDTFSMGFGPKIYRRKKGETEYCLSAIPLGGYVKLLGQDPNEEVPKDQEHRMLSKQEPWKRFLVFMAGPLFNFLFAVVIFGTILLVGEPHVASIVERVTPGSQAYQAGFRSSDLITAVGSRVVNKFDEVQDIVSESSGKELVFRVKRKDGFHELRAIPRPTSGFSVYGEVTEVGRIDGLFAFGRYTAIGVSDPRSPAAKAELKTGDEIVTFNGAPVKSFEALSERVDEELSKTGDSKKGTVFTFGVVPHAIAYWQFDRRPSPIQAATREVKLPARKLGELGIYSSELFVASAVKGSPAEAVGLLPGDRLVALDDYALPSFNDLRDQVQAAGEKSGKFVLRFERLGKILSREITPTANEVKDALGRDIKQYLIGVYPLFAPSEPQTFVERSFNPLTITVEAWSRALDLTSKTIISLKKLITRQVSMGTLGGPLLIGKLAGDSLGRGLAHFLKMMALISISLAVFNILPVPILDGGHIFLLLVEVVRGKPISVRQSEVVQQLGLTLILLLLVVVMFNDISRVGLPAIRRMFE